ncbi:PPE domain-containing protein [Gordonia westfalica]|uniref:PPE family protein n=1 Tax=Gordonia westfalica TaxID=158898 RepID=A0A1H2LVM8_9ACTN|nr:PPE domain-containing protein [Gordonia westfalica]SDU84748.1 PPE family protein [Gordonia westfalica]
MTNTTGLGFTGVNWDLRTSEQLATDLGAGPGPAPLAEAGLAWTALAAEVGEAGIGYAAVLTRLGLSWQSAQTSAVFERLTQFAPWFADTATEAIENAARAEAQAAATTVARLNMPNLAEVEVVEKLHEIATTATAVAPIIAGAAAEAERAVVQQRMRASRVMQAYENAAEPVGKPWASSRRAPELVTSQALAAEKAAAARAAAPKPVAPPATPVVPPMFGGLGGAYAPPAEKLRYAPTVVASAVSPSATPVAAPAGSAAAPGPGVPPPLAPGMSAAGDRGATIRGVSVDAGASDPDEGLARASDSLDAPLTWADIETSDRPAAHYVSAPDAESAKVDPRYLSETLLLGNPGDRA